MGVNRVAGSFYPPALTPPTVGARSGRFMQSFIRTVIRTLTGYAQNAHKTGILGLRRTRLTRSGLSSSIEPPIAPPRFAGSALHVQPIS